MPNRTVCDVLSEMRTCYETRNFSPIMGLIEEVQSMANKMEAALYDKHDLGRARKEYKKLDKKVKKLEKKAKKLDPKSESDD